MVNIHEIGNLFEYSNIEDEEPKQLKGWHVNSSEDIKEWKPFEVIPTSPRVKFPEGVKTYYYSFPSELIYNKYMLEENA